ncbi:MAG: flippase [Nitrospirae bacterium YQR-1]
MGLLRNISFLTASQVVEKILSLLIIVFISRKLGAVEFGLYTLVMSFVSLFYYFYDGGLGNFLVKEVGKNREIGRGYLKRIFTLRLVLCVCAVVLSLITAYMAGYGKREFYGIVIFSFATAFVYISSILRAPFMGIERMEIESALTVTFRFLCAAAILILLAIGIKMPLLMLPYLFSAVVVMFMSLFIFKRYFNNYKTGGDDGNIKMLTILKNSVPFALTAFMGEVFFNIDKVILAKYETLSAVGLYNGAYKIVLVGMFIPSGITMAAYPRMANLWVSGKSASGDFINQLTKPLLALGLCFSFITAVNSTEITTAVFGAKFSDSAYILKHLIWIVPAIFLGHLTDIVLQATQRQWFACVSMTIAVSVNVLLNFLLIPVVHAAGCVYAALVTIYSVFIVRMYIINKDVNGAFKPWLYIRFLLITLFSGTLCYVIKGYLPWQAEAAFGVFVFFAGLYAAGCITRRDVKFLLEIRKAGANNYSP